MGIRAVAGRPAEPCVPFLTRAPADADDPTMSPNGVGMASDESVPEVSSAASPIGVPVGVGEEEEAQPSVGDAARALYARRHDPDLSVDMRIASPASGLLWIGGGVLGLLMLPLAPPDRALGPIGWALAAILVIAALATGVQRLHASTSGIRALFVGSLIALTGIAVLEWLAGGRPSPYHQLYALPMLYAAAVQPRVRALAVLGFMALIIWAPLLYASAGGRVPADIAGQLLLLATLALVGRIIFTVLRAQRSGLRRAREQAHQLARRDSLTGLGNRLGLEETLEVEVARARRQKSHLSLIVGDIDGFKAVNDAFGHAGGDDCLRSVAAALEDASRTEDQCFRWAGDEFVVVLPETAAREAAEVRRRVCTAASGVCASLTGEGLRLTCGTAELGPDDSVQSLLAAADQMLLEFKRPAARTSVPTGPVAPAGSPAARRG